MSYVDGVEVDVENWEVLKVIIEVYGFFMAEQVGEEGMYVVFIFIQYVDWDLEW